MTPIQVIIVDDEPIAQDILESFLLKVPGFELAGKCRNALEAFSIINRQPIDLMLLDINMPEINGLNFLRNLRNPPLVILTTAYGEFALEGYELNAVDYLLKPIPFERFFKAMDKAMKLLQSSRQVSQNEAEEKQEELMFVKSGTKLIKLAFAELCFVEGLKDYMKFVTINGNIVVHSTMKNIEDQLASNRNFIRIHKSYIVNLRFISEVNGNLIKIRDQQLAIGNTYKEEVLKVLAKHKLQ